MDRTSILGDTIDYMKELLERIKQLQEEMEVESDSPNLLGLFRDSNEMLVRNSPKVWLIFILFVVQMLRRKFLCILYVQKLGL